MTQFNNRIHYSRQGFLVLAWVFVICIVAQTFIAGMAIFNNYAYWGYHTTFVIGFQFIPVLMLILAFTGRISKRIRWQVVALFLLIVPLQYVSVHVPVIGAIHPVVPFVLFLLTLRIIKQVKRAGE
ncbi:hypothetical protein KFZ56_02480 [Virgibacillus sp. NKC19-3]|uniref:DUF6220 domain-containing protein n=1 Tax=Virgibacillus saliphilus TaxID=2831674 RepID=UPI001C9AA58A|nr:DUF6220 domain-containing protein [Virgibacillus sp. NKC19-3]MBY7141970.1 hypothetical protein [Virgibacillus sp. NKC19-3]